LDPVACAARTALAIAAVDPSSAAALRPAALAALAAAESRGEGAADVLARAFVVAGGYKRVAAAPSAPAAAPAAVAAAAPPPPPGAPAAAPAAAAAVVAPRPPSPPPAAASAPQESTAASVSAAATTAASTSASSSAEPPPPASPSGSSALARAVSGTSLRWLFPVAAPTAGAHSVAAAATAAAAEPAVASPPPPPPPPAADPSAPSDELFAVEVRPPRAHSAGHMEYEIVVLYRVHHAQDGTEGKMFHYAVRKRYKQFAALDGALRARVGAAMPAIELPPSYAHPKTWLGGGPWPVGERDEKFLEVRCEGLHAYLEGLFSFLQADGAGGIAAAPEVREFLLWEQRAELHALMQATAAAEPEAGAAAGAAGGSEGAPGAGREGPAPAAAAPS
jgi:hypothetical protein